MMLRFLLVGFRDGIPRYASSTTLRTVLKRPLSEERLHRASRNDLMLCFPKQLYILNLLRQAHLTISMSKVQHANTRVFMFSILLDFPNLS